MKFWNPKTKPQPAPIQTIITGMVNELDAVTPRFDKNLNNSADKETLISTLTVLVNEIISLGKNGAFNITAQKHRALMILHISHSGPFNFNVISNKLSTLLPPTGKKNGYIGLTTYLDNSTSIAFSLENFSCNYQSN
jgi:hypothetical protein